MHLPAQIILSFRVFLLSLRTLFSVININQNHPYKGLSLVVPLKRH